MHFGLCAVSIVFYLCGTLHIHATKLIFSFVFYAYTNFTMERNHHFFLFGLKTHKTAQTHLRDAVHAFTFYIYRFDGTERKATEPKCVQRMKFLGFLRSNGE